MDQFNQQLQQLQQQLQQMQQDNQNLQQQVLQVNQAAQQVQAAAAALPVPQAQFTLSPAVVDVANIIDYHSRAGLKIYEQATEALPTPFDLEKANLHVFLDQLNF